MTTPRPTRAEVEQYERDGGLDWGDSTYAQDAMLILAQALLAADDALRLAEWGAEYIDTSLNAAWEQCPVCYAKRVDGHKGDCRLAEALLEQDSSQ